MIPYDNSLVRFEYVELKSVSQALGGSVRIIDQDASEQQDKEVTVRYEVPFSVARDFVKTHKPASFIVPKDACIVWFGDQIVAIETRPDTDHRHIDLPSGQSWMSLAQLNFNRTLSKQAVGPNWFTDGTFVYELPSNLEAQIQSADYLTHDGLFRALSVEAYKYTNLSDTRLMDERLTRSCVACIHPNGDVILTPPIWKNVLDIRKQSGEKESDTVSYRFDMINTEFHVNLEFGLNAGRTIGSVFGYNQISPLMLDELMIHLRTVNLPKVPKSTRATFGIGLNFLEAFAWVAGKTAQCENMSDFSKMRGLMKQLCTKGIFRTQTLDRIYKKDVPQNAPQMIDPAQALRHVEDNVDDDTKYEFWRRGKSEEKMDHSVANAIGSMIHD